MRRLFTSESVTEGHPDKVCDQVSDSILDAIFSQDNKARVACECSCTSNFLLIMGEITTTANINIEEIARETIKNIGYDSDDYGFNYKNVEIKVLLNKQSPDIAQGVNSSIENENSNDNYDVIGAGDQGMMFGYANDETEEYMPLAIMLSHKICARLAEVRKNKEVDYLRPDGKAQVTVEYEDNMVKRIDTVVISTQHNAEVSRETLVKDMIELVAKKVIDEKYIDENTKFLINPTGRFVVGGPEGDSGLTGRKIIVDTYGGYVAHGGGAFSGKDPTKVDRSAAYYARYVAKNVVASGACKSCELQLAYAIGKATPVSIDIKIDGKAVDFKSKIANIINKVFDFRPQAIISQLKLNTPTYLKTASYGHFGKEDLSWEKLDKVEEIKSLL